MEYFVFEQDFIEKGIRCIPMVVRLRLDLVGIKLRLSDWNHFSPGEREALASLPFGGDTERALYRNYLKGIIEGHSRPPAEELPVETIPAWKRMEEVPSELLEKAAEFGWTVSKKSWEQLRELERFALLKLCRPGHENKNFPKAMREFGLDTGRRMITPELVVVGAGPGDPELISLKAVKALQRADVIMYDNLINRDLLCHASASAEKIYVGKLPYGDYTPQEDIHRMLLEKAMLKGCVVRLKGGDPFIFGRGMEELMFARANGLKASYIPGITAMQAIGMEDIPLTHRGVSESVWLLTGTKEDGSLTRDLSLAIESKATVVIYMGMKKLEAISKVYVDQGKGAMPAAIIQHASLDHKKKKIGRVKDLTSMAREGGLQHPALIVIGEVVWLCY